MKITLDPDVTVNGELRQEGFCFESQYNGILPPGCIYYRHAPFAAVIQQPPQVRTIEHQINRSHWTSIQSRLDKPSLGFNGKPIATPVMKLAGGNTWRSGGERVQGEYQKFTLAFPYTIFALLGDNEHPLAFFSNKPITSMNDPLYMIPLGNMIGADLCPGYSPSSRFSDKRSTTLTRHIEAFWNNRFNFDHGEYDVRHIFNWAKIKPEDILNANWTKYQYTLDKILAHGRYRHHYHNILGAVLACKLELSQAKK